jgi:RNA polymerase sigma-70 factor, ECF subfamily
MIHQNGKRSPEVLLAAARAGNPAALGQLLDGYRNYLWLLARAQTNAALRSKASPSDLVQDTFLEAYRAFRDFEGTGEAALLAWLRRILIRNSIADALCRLPADYREVLVLRHIDRLKFEEIAARLGKTSGAVRKVWTRALVKLRAVMRAHP